MTISANALEVLIVAATALAAIAPIILLILWVRDRKGGNLW
jgi:hypothetical protein